MGRIKVILDEGMDYMMITDADRDNILFEISKSLTAKSNKSKYTNILLDIERCKLIGYRKIDDGITDIYKERISYVMNNTSYSEIKTIASDILYNIEKKYLINMAYYYKICNSYDKVVKLCENSEDSNENVMFLENGLLECLRSMIVFFEEVLQSYNMKFVNKPMKSYFSLNSDNSVYRKNIVQQKYKKLYNSLLNRINKFYDVGNTESILVLKFQLMSCMIELNSIYCLTQNLNCGINEKSKESIYNVLSICNNCISMIDDYLQTSISTGVISVEDIKKDIFNIFGINIYDKKDDIVSSSDCVDFVMQDRVDTNSNIKECDNVINELYAVKFTD